MPHHSPEARAIDTIKGFFEINEVYEQKRDSLKTRKAQLNKAKLSAINSPAVRAKNAKHQNDEKRESKHVRIIQTNKKRLCDIITGEDWFLLRQIGHKSFNSSEAVTHK